MFMTSRGSLRLLLSGSEIAGVMQLEKRRCGAFSLCSSDIFVSAEFIALGGCRAPNDLASLRLNSLSFHPGGKGAGYCAVEVKLGRRME